MSISDIDWLCRPTAHRAFHNAENGIVENTRSAVLSAMDRHYAIEVDLQASLENQPVVFHDWTLDSLTMQAGDVNAFPIDMLTAIQHKNSPDTIMSLQDLLNLVEGRVPLLLEIKAKPNADNLEVFGKNIGQILRNYSGQVAVMSFVPEVVQSCVQEAPHLSRGLTISYYDSPFSSILRFLFTYFFKSRHINPQFVAYDVRSLPGFTPFIMKNIFGLKLLVWTVRNKKQRKMAEKWADAMIFEGFEV